jgi:murein DD-endopeptidase MepM/ murein hydrolase activator NlpD
MARTQRMADASLSSGQSGWYETGSRLQLLCHKRGQAVKGYYSPYLPNGGWDDLWYKVSDNYFVADVDINTGSNNPVVNACETGGQPGVNGWAYPILPHSTLTTYPNHSGDDFPVGTGTPVYSMGTGPVTFSTYAVTSAWCPVPGAIGRQQTDLRISTNRDGHTYLITYAHMNSYTVSSGQTVQAGQLIGYSGARGCADGPHLHVDMKVDGVANVMYPRNIFGTSY